ncbi:MAG: dTDP-glucose pyrophosphorylase [Nitrospirae bacterium]|nr:dTDP-glucose pyrophosphorylase [Nitrospirota bacterium]
MSNSSKLAPKKPWDREIVGLVPAAGKAKRIAPLPMSKELFPIGFQTMNGRPQPSPKVVAHYLLEKFYLAGITEAYIVLRKGKWDIPAYFGDGAFVNMHLGYLIMREPFGPPFTLDQAYPFVHNKVVAFGFPDIMFSSKDVFKQLLEYRETHQPDVVLALFPAHNPQSTDMVDIDKNGKIHNMLLNPANTELYFTWLCGVWTPVFTSFMHEYLQTYRRENSSQNAKTDEAEGKDLTVGDVIQAAITKGLAVHGVTFPDSQYIDIGTPEALLQSVELFGLHSS